MKFKYYTLALIFSIALQRVTAQVPAAQSNWYQQAITQLDNGQRQLRPLKHGQFAAFSAGQDISYRIKPLGYQAQNIHGDLWTVEFQVQSVNGQALEGRAGHSISSDSNELTYHFSTVDVQYQNQKEGLRQNFIVHRGTHRGLRLRMAISTALAVALHARDGLVFTDNKGKSRLAYDGLAVWDARHRRLPASMQLDGGALEIVVDDRRAVYPVTIDPLNHAPNWTDSGNGLVLPLLNDLATPVLYGYSISDAGDVNGDGYGDVIIGAPAYVQILNITSGTFNTASVGAAFLYYGSPTGPATHPSEILQPTTQVGALFGYSVSKAGDINGDGYADIVIGAPGDRISLNVGVIPTATSVAAGKIYVYYGGPGGSFDGNPATSPTVSATLALQQSDFGSLLSLPQNPLYGFSVSNAGDVNGDGYADIAVGSPAYLRLLPLPLRAGRVDIYQGSASGLSATPSRTITGGVLNGLFGYSVSTAGNVNKDNNNGKPLSDIIVGAPGSLSLAGAGQAFIFHGSATGITATSSSQANTTLSGGLLSTLFGFSVSDAGDVNGDSYPDVIVGEPAALESLLSQTAAVGAAHIYYGGASGVTTAGSTTLTSPRRPSLLGILNGNLLFGFSVSNAGDVDCDGYADVIVGEPGGTALSLGSGLAGLVSTNVLAGKSYIYTGRSSKPVNDPGYTIEQSGSVSVANLIGYSVSAGGDYNGDGRADVLVGAPNGTLDLSGGIVPAVGSALNIVTSNSIGSAYAYSGCIQTNIILPVQLLDFTAKAVADKAALQWTASHESGIQHYAVERSADGADFQTIGIVFPMDAPGDVTYKFTDEHPLAVNYYRIRPVSQNSGERYSSIEQVRFGATRGLQFFAWPNPARETFTFSCSSLPAGMYELRLYDTKGAVVQTSRVALANGPNSIPMKRKGLTAGMYTASLFNTYGEKLQTTRIVLQ